MIAKYDIGDLVVASGLIGDFEIVGITPCTLGNANFNQATGYFYDIKSVKDGSRFNRCEDDLCKVFNLTPRTGYTIPLPGNYSINTNVVMASNNLPQGFANLNDLVKSMYDGDNWEWGSNRPPPVKCTCGVHKVMGDVEYTFHSDWCDYYKDKKPKETK